MVSEWGGEGLEGGVWPLPPTVSLAFSPLPIKARPQGRAHANWKLLLCKPSPQMLLLRPRPRSAHLVKKVPSAAKGQQVGFREGVAGFLLG